MGLQLNSKHIVVLGFILVMRASVTESRTPTTVRVNTDESRCNPSCNNAEGWICLLGMCIKCGDCPENPFDVEENGYLNVYEPCIQNGFCPKVCSSYLRLGSFPLANETLCEDINAPKVTTAQTTTKQVVETTNTGSTDGTSMKPVTEPEPKPTTATHRVKITDNNGSKGYLLEFAFGLIIFGSVIFGLVCFFRLIKKSDKPNSRGSSTRSLTEITDQLIPCTYEPLEIKLDPENKTATVKDLQRLGCNALQLCACLYNPDCPDKNWMLTGGLDEMQLPGLMIPDQVYTVRAGRVTDGKEFECLAEGKVDTEAFSNVTLDEECSTTIGDIFEIIELRKSLQVELYQPEMIDVITFVFELKGDDRIVFRNKKSLEELHDEILTNNGVADSKIHPWMEHLAKSVNAKDFVRKIAKRDTNRPCKKCLVILHRMCCGNYGQSVAVNIPNDLSH